jgi:small GTP-binding protein
MERTLSKQIMRIVVTGPVGAGKTTLIKTISEIDVVETDRAATDESALLKPNTTVAMDFGRITFGADMAVHIYGTPGQERFSFMWDILVHRAHALMLLVPLHRPSDFFMASKMLRYLQFHASDVPLVVVGTHRDLPDAWPAAEVLPALGIEPDAGIPIFSVNATQTREAVQVLIALIEQYQRLTQSHAKAG